MKWVSPALARLSFAAAPLVIALAVGFGRSAQHPASAAESAPEKQAPEKQAPEKQAPEKQTPEKQTTEKQQARTVILVRHAEKASDDPRDPSLSEAGRERAQALAQLLARSGAVRLVASEYKRTQQTLAPLAQGLGLTVESMPARDVDALAASLAATASGATVVVAGHSNTVPALAARLGAPLAAVSEGPQGPALDEAEFDRLFVLTLPPAGSPLAPSVLELAYGRASP